MSGIKKYGTFAGVFTPSLLTILGVIMYMRMGAVVGNSTSIWMTIGIIVMAHVISVTTGLSVSSVATDKKIKAGGIYYMLSRSLGLSIGGAIGVTIFVATALSIALYLIGFAESALMVFGWEDITVNHLRVGGSVALALVVSLALISTSLAMKAQYFILAIIGVSLISVGFGDADGLKEGTDVIANPSFALLFGIFFPAVTGFTAGVAMSGDLKDPVKSIPWGTMMAIAVGLIIYIGLAFFLYYAIPSNILSSNNNALVEFAWYGGLFVVAGIWGATLSSALGGILGAPRILQAMSKDTITPAVFGKGVGVNNEPRNALILTAIIAFCGILIGELNAIAEIVAMFYMTAYLFINLTCLLEQAFSPDFKPTFKISIVVPAIGVLATFILMIQLNLIAALVAIGAVILLFFYYSKKHLDSGSGDVWNSVWFSMVKRGLKNLQKKSTHKRNWEPNVLLFSGDSNRRNELIAMSKSIAGTNGMISNFDLIENTSAEVLFPKHQQTILEGDENDGSIFYRQQECQNIYRGIENIANSYGFSGIDPNTVLMGWARNTNQPKEFVKMTNYLTQLDMNVLFLDYDEQKGYGEMKTLDIWWSHFDEYCDLSLYLGKFLLSSEDWGHVSIRVLYDNQDNSAADYIEKIIYSKCETNRIEAEVVIVNNELEQKPLYDLVRKYSIQTDLIFLELPVFEEQDEEKFIASTNDLLHEIGTSLIFRASSHFYEDINLDPSLQKEYMVAQGVLEFERKDVDFVAQNSQFPEVDVHVSQIGNSLYELHHKYSKEFYQSFSDVYRAFLKILFEIQNSNQNNTSQLKAAFDDFNENRLNVVKRTMQVGMKNLLLECQDVVSNSPKSISLSFDKQMLDVLATDSKSLIKSKKRLANKGGILEFPLEKSISHHIEEYYLKQFKKVLYVNGLSGFMINRNLIKTFENNEFSLEEALIRLDNSIQREQNIFQQFSKSYIQKFLQEIIKDVDDLDIIDKVIEREESRGDSALKKVLLGLSKFPEAFISNQKLHGNQVVSLLELKYVTLKLTSEFSDSVSLMVNELGNLSSQVSTITHDWCKLTASAFLSEERQIQEDLSFSTLLNKMNCEIGEAVSVVSEHIKVISPDSLNSFEKEQENVDVSEVSFKKTTIFALEKEFSLPLSKTLNAFNLELKNHISELNKGLKLLYYHYSDSNSNEKEGKEVQQMIQNKVKTLEDSLADLSKRLLEQVAFFTEKIDKTLNIEILLNQTNFSQSGMLKSKALAEGGSYIGNTKKVFRKIDQKLDDILIKLRDTVSKSSFEYRTKGLLNLQSRLGDFVAHISLNDAVAANVPYYYQQLFTGKQMPPKQLLEHRSLELEIASAAVAKWNAGSSGVVLFTGELLSGKTFVKQNFIYSISKKDVVKVEYLKGGTKNSFENLLQKATGNYNDVDSILSELEDGTILDVSDIEYYWGMNHEDSSEFEKLLIVIKKHYHRLLFLLDCNVHFYNHAKSLYGIDDYILTTVLVRPLSTSNIKNIVLDRHQSGGMKYFYNGVHESDTKLRNVNRIFTRINQICNGNVGSALHYWLGNVERVESNVLVLGKLDSSDLDFNLKTEWELILYQIIMRKSINSTDLFHLFNDGGINVEIELDNLLRSRIVTKSLSNELEINPYAMIFVVNYLRKHQIIL